MIESKAAANEVFGVKSSLNEMMEHLKTETLSVWHKVREGLPPDGFWSEVSEKLADKADKKVRHSRHNSSARGCDTVSV